MLRYVTWLLFALLTLTVGIGVASLWMEPAALGFGRENLVVVDRGYLEASSYTSLDGKSNPVVRFRNSNSIAGRIPRPLKVTDWTLPGLRWQYIRWTERQTEWSLRLCLLIPATIFAIAYAISLWRLIARVKKRRTSI